MPMSFSLLHLLLEFGQDVRWQFVLAVTFQVWLPAYVKRGMADFRCLAKPMNHTHDDTCLDC